MPTNSRSARRWGRRLVLLITLGVVVGIVVAVWYSTEPVLRARGCTGTVDGHSVYLEPDQARNATLVAAHGVRRGLPARAVSIALATAYQESKIRNLDYGDRDSLGIFQQRPSQGWGSKVEVRDPHHATNRFYDALEQIPGYESMRITEAAQQVQRSAYPEAYEKHARNARVLASALTGYSAGGRFSCITRSAETPGTAAGVIASLTGAYGPLDAARTGVRQDLTIDVGRNEVGHRLGWSIAAFLLTRAETDGIVSVTYDGLRWRTGPDSAQGWTPTDATTPGVVTVSLG